MENKPHPTLECDLILKGGITSGVVYPGVVSELHQTYRFRNIGGTSAGAIAAAATAAAEVGRQTGQGGFTKLETLPDWLGTVGESGQTNLASLFRPNKKAERFHKVLLSLLGNKGNRLRHLLRTAVALFPLPFWLGVLPGLAMIVLALVDGTGPLAPVSLLAGLLLALLGGVGAVAYRLYQTSSQVLKDNHLGLTTGHDLSFNTGHAQNRLNYEPGRSHAGSHFSTQPESISTSPESPMLTDWLSDFLDNLAGVGERDYPLTFGDLEAQGVNLHVITTSVTHGRPYGLPFREVEPGKPGKFYIKQADLHAFFPKKVADWLELKSGEDGVTNSSDTYLRLPVAQDLPVVVAVRLSLSFPLLISAVPLYAVDYTRKDKDHRVLERCWFTDGGVSSNFPVHLFDAPLPTRPTFAVNLRPHHVDHGPGSEAFERNQGVWMPNRNGDGHLAWWHRFERDGGVGSFLAFLKATVETGLNWQDTLLAGAPGHRDRIVHIGLSDDEGGLNLNMNQPTITTLFERGRVAGRELVSRFAKVEHVLDWDNHRWIRYRTLMMALEDMHSKLERAYTFEREGERNYANLLARGKNEAPKSYHLARQSQRHKEFAEKMTAELLELAAKWSDSEVSLKEGAPQPGPGIRVVPEV